MSIKQKNDIRHYCIWLHNKAVGMLISESNSDEYLLAGVTKDGIYVQKLLYSYCGTSDILEVNLDEKEFVPLAKVCSYKYLTTRYDLLEKADIETVNVEELINRLFIPYEVGEVISILNSCKYLIIGLQNDSVELLNITDLENVTLKGIKELLSKGRPKGSIIASSYLSNCHVKVEKQFKEESIKALALKVKMTWKITDII